MSTREVLALLPPVRVSRALLEALEKLELNSGTRVEVWVGVLLSEALYVRQERDRVAAANRALDGDAN